MLLIYKILFYNVINNIKIPIKYLINLIMMHTILESLGDVPFPSSFFLLIVNYLNFCFLSESYCCLLRFLVMLRNVWCEIPKVQITHYESQILLLILSYSIANLWIWWFFFNTSSFSNSCGLNDSRNRIFKVLVRGFIVDILCMKLMHHLSILFHFISLINIFMEGEIVMEVYTLSLWEWSFVILLLPIWQ